MLLCAKHTLTKELQQTRANKAEHSRLPPLNDCFLKFLFACFPGFVVTINVNFVLPIIGCFVFPIKYTFNRDLRGALGMALTDLSGLPGLPVRLPGYPVSTRLPGYPVFFWRPTRLPGYPVTRCLTLNSINRDNQKRFLNY